jgi:chromosome segregation ATPase
LGWFATPTELYQPKEKQVNIDNEISHLDQSIDDLENLAESKDAKPNSALSQCLGLIARNFTTQKNSLDVKQAAVNNEVYNLQSRLENLGNENQSLKSQISELKFHKEFVPTSDDMTRTFKKTIRMVTGPLTRLEMEHIKNHNKINAIKEYRARTGHVLLVSKTVVEAHEDNIPGGQDYEFKKAQNSLAFQPDPDFDPAKD